MQETAGHQYVIASYWEQLVAAYARITLIEVEHLDYFVYLQLRRDALIARLSQSEKGLEYLDNAWRLTQTKPERKKLREKYGAREVTGWRRGET